MPDFSILRKFRIIIRPLSRYKSDLIVLSILGVVSAVANGAVPFLVGGLFDAILVPSRIFENTSVEMSLAFFLIAAWLATQLIANFVDWRLRIKNESMSTDVFTEYMRDGVETLLQFPLSFHRKQKIGETFEKVGRAARSFEQIIGNVIINLSPQFLSIIVALVITFFINPLLTGILLLGVFTYAVILAYNVGPTVKLQKKVFSAYSKAYGQAYDTVINIEAVKHAGREAYETKRTEKNFVERAGGAWKKLWAIWQNLSFYQRMIVLAVQTSIFLLSILFIARGEMTIGQLVMFNGYAAMLFGPFVMLGNNWQTIQNGLTVIDETERLLAGPKEMYSPANAIKSGTLKGDIHFHNVYFSYGKKDKDVLSGVTFQVNSGNVIALVGESGAGKSTLIDLISAYYFPQRGKVTIDSESTSRYNISFLRKQIATVPQEVVLFNDTVFKNIAYGKPSASKDEIVAAAKRAHAHEFIEQFPKGYKSIVGERGIKLSVGQKQRIAIARAILRDPRILILDEPTSALDAKSEKYIQESLAELMKSRTTFVIAHRLSTVRKADKIIVLDKGKIVEEGRHTELIKIPNGVYRHLYELQIGFVE